jgi:hypothetical protein
MFGFCESGVCRGLVTKMPIINDIVRRDIMDGRRALGLVHIHNSREHLIIDMDLFSRIFRLLISFRDNNRDMITNITHFALRESGVSTRLHRRAILIVDHPAANQTTDFISRKIVTGQNTQNARGFFGC